MKSLHRVTAAFLAFSFAPAAFAQNFGGATNFGQAVCSFLQSPIISIIFAIILIALILAWLNDLVKGIAMEIVKLLIGAFAILNIGTVLSWLGMNPIC